MDGSLFHPQELIYITAITVMTIRIILEYRNNINSNNNFDSSDYLPKLKKINISALIQPIRRQRFSQTVHPTLHRSCYHLNENCC